MSNEIIKITLPDGSVREYPKGSSAMDVAISISEGLARNVLSAEVNGEVWDADRKITQDSTLKLLTWNDDDGKATLRSAMELIFCELERLMGRD